MMIPSFSFKYNGVEYNSGQFKNNKCIVDDTLTVTLEKNEYAKYDACEWILYFENTSRRNSGIISNICDCNTKYNLGEVPFKKNGYISEPGNVFIKTMNGMVDGAYYWDNDKISADEYQFADEYLADGATKIYKNICGRSSEGMMPFFTLEYKNQGLIFAIGWTGSWKAEYTRNGDSVNIKSGLRNTKFYLKSGEKIRTTSTLIMEYSENQDRFNKFRRLIKNHFSHMACTSAEREGIMAFELWGGLPSSEMVKRVNELKEYDVRFEDIWIDAGWYGQCDNCDEAFSGDWGEHTGEWEVNKRVHPNNLEDVKSVVESADMSMMLWFEPERVKPTVPLFKEKPDWFLSIPNSSDHILYYGNESCVEYVYNLLSDYVKKLNLSCYRQDFNTDLKVFFDENEEENRIGILEIKHIMGMYEVWDRLLSAHPHLVIDNCASGGRRIDIETLKRSIPFFRSDYQCNFNANPEVIQTHNAGISNYFPFNGCTTKTKSDTYAVRSSYSSSWGGAYYNAVFQSMNVEDFQWAKKISDEYLKIRHYFSMDFYNHCSCVYDDASWAIWQYNDYENDKGVVMAFRRPSSPFKCVDIDLKGIKKNNTYSLNCFDDVECILNDGKLKITLTEKRSSVIVEYYLSNKNK